ncbi:MAG TPA: sugar ABC transporter ATP-binding protein, partial [Candidatus Hydrogenedentes bacterium]|nr:sugar ABC transporter ATP-binding protein [Candidatus Hydrogenedentota bacterium]
MAEPLLVLQAIHKSFGGAPALRGANLEICPGEIHGLVGENGAGKSTLINIATGVLQPDSGAIVLAGENCALASPRQAAARGIAVVHQEADLFPQMSLAENMLLERGLARTRWGLIDWRGVRREAAENLAALGEQFDVQAPAAGLSVGRRMVSGIAAAVAQQARILFLDEPTSSLTMREIESLFERLRTLRDQGVAIIYVSHRLEEVLELCDRVTVMRDGETISTRPVRELNLDQIVSAMVGRDMSGLTVRRSATPGAPLLCVKNANDVTGVFLDVSLDIRAGEIMGMYGFVGAGRSEFAQSLFGLRPMSGEVSVNGVTLRTGATRRAIRAGLAYLPEDRLVQGVFRSHSLRANAGVAALRSLGKQRAVASSDSPQTGRPDGAFLAFLRRLPRFGWISARAERALAENVVSEMRVRAVSIEQPIATLSGGNQQKVVFGRWQAMRPRVLL